MASLEAACLGNGATTHIYTGEVVQSTSICDCILS
jgi:hypothetical protein